MKPFTAIHSWLDTHLGLHKNKHFWGKITEVEVWPKVGTTIPTQIKDSNVNLISKFQGNGNFKDGNHD